MWCNKKFASSPACSYFDYHTAVRVRSSQQPGHTSQRMCNIVWLPPSSAALPPDRVVVVLSADPLPTPKDYHHPNLQSSCIRCLFLSCVRSTLPSSGVFLVFIRIFPIRTHIRSHAIYFEPISLLAQPYSNFFRSYPHAHTHVHTKARAHTASARFTEKLLVAAVCACVCVCAPQPTASVCAHALAHSLA